MKYLCLIYDEERKRSAMSQSELDALIGEYMAFTAGWGPQVLACVGKRRGGDTREIEGLEGEAALAPGLQTAGQRAHPRDAVPSQEERHTGAGRLVGSGAVENDIPVPRDLAVAALQLLRRHAEGPGDGVRDGLEVERVPQIHDQDVLPVP